MFTVDTNAYQDRWFHPVEPDIILTTKWLWRANLTPYQHILAEAVRESPKPLWDEYKGARAHLQVCCGSSVSLPAYVFINAISQFRRIADDAQRISNAREQLTF